MSVGQEQQNRKILEDLQQQKKRLRLQTQPGTGSLGSQTRTKDGPPSSMSRDPGEAHHLAMQQRQALQHAHSNSAAYFVTQDSAFGNLILPVIPRLPPD